MRFLRRLFDPSDINGERPRMGPRRAALYAGSAAVVVSLAMSRAVMGSFDAIAQILGGAVLAGAAGALGGAVFAATRASRQPEPPPVRTAADFSQKVKDAVQALCCDAPDKYARLRALTLAECQDALNALPWFSGPRPESARQLIQFELQQKLRASSDEIKDWHIQGLNAVRSPLPHIKPTSYTPAVPDAAVRLRADHVMSLDRLAELATEALERPTPAAYVCISSFRDQVVGVIVRPSGGSVTIADSQVVWDIGTPEPVVVPAALPDTEDWHVPGLSTPRTPLRNQKPFEYVPTHVGGAVVFANGSRATTQSLAVDANNALQRPLPEAYRWIAATRARICRVVSPSNESTTVATTVTTPARAVRSRPVELD